MKSIFVTPAMFQKIGAETHSRICVLTTDHYNENEPVRIVSMERNYISRNTDFFYRYVGVVCSVEQLTDDEFVTDLTLQVDSLPF